MCARTRLLTGFWMLYSMLTSYAISCSFCPEPSLSLATHFHCVLCWLRHRTYQNYKSLSRIHTAVTMNTQHLTGPRHPRSTLYTESLHITEAEAEYSMNPALFRQILTHPTTQSGSSSSLCRWSTDVDIHTIQSGSSSSLCQWFLLWQLCCPLYKPRKHFLAVTTGATCISG